MGFIAGFVVYAVFLYRSSARTLNIFSLRPKMPEKGVLRGVTPYAGFMLLGAVSIALRDQADKIILASTASPAWTGYFSVAARLTSLVLMVCTSVYVPIIAAAGAMQSRGDWPGVQRLYSDAMTAMAFIVGLFSALVTGLYDRILIFWIGKPINEVGVILYFLIAGNAIAVLLTGTGSAVCKGIGIIQIETIYIIVGLVLNLMLKFILIPLIGPIGTVISSATSWALASVLFVTLLHRKTKLPVAGTVRAVKSVAIGAACAFFARWLSTQLPIESSRLGAFVSIVELTIVITLLFAILMILFRALPISVWSSVLRIIRNKYETVNSRF